jgi:hypothetical protein
MSRNFGEIIKNYISLFGGKPARGLPTPSPTSPRAVTTHFTRVGQQSASWMCEIYSRESLEGGGEGRVICGTVPFINGLSDQLQTQNQDSQYYYAPSLFRQDLSNSYWWLWQASANLYLYIVEGGYKRELEPVASPQSTTLHSAGNTSVKKEVVHSNTRGTVRLCSIPAEILLHILYIFNILCGLKVINSRRLQ